MYFLFLLLSCPIWAIEPLSESENFARDSYVYFVPPSDWKLAEPDERAKHVEIVLFGKSDARSGFCPSLNFAKEKIAISPQDYLEAVKKRHQARPNHQWRDLGPFETEAGSARLFCIDAPSQQGDLRLLQLIFFKESCAYILTAGSLRRDFLTLLPTFQSAFRSLTYTKDLFSAIKDEKQRERLRNSSIATAGAWKKCSDSLRSMQEFEKQLSREYASLGAHWQLLLMKQLVIE